MHEQAHDRACADDLPVLEILAQEIPAAVGRGGDVALVIDARDRYLIPGLLDVHVRMAARRLRGTLRGPAAYPTWEERRTLWSRGGVGVRTERTNPMNTQPREAAPAIYIALCRQEINDRE